MAEREVARAKEMMIDTEKKAVDEGRSIKMTTLEKDHVGEVEVVGEGNSIQKKEGIQALKEKRKKLEDEKKKRRADHATSNAEIKAKEVEVNENLKFARQSQGCDPAFDQSAVNKIKKDLAAVRTHRKSLIDKMKKDSGVASSHSE